MGHFDRFIENITKDVRVRRHNGECEYGPWLAAGDEDNIPMWVAGLIADAIAEEDLDWGIVEQEGERFSWEKFTPTYQVGVLSGGRRLLYIEETGKVVAHVESDTGPAIIKGMTEAQARRRFPEAFKD